MRNKCQHASRIFVRRRRFECCVAFASLTELLSTISWHNMFRCTAFLEKFDSSRDADAVHNTFADLNWEMFTSRHCTASDTSLLLCAGVVVPHHCKTNFEESTVTSDSLHAQMHVVDKMCAFLMTLIMTSVWDRWQKKKRGL